MSIIKPKMEKPFIKGGRPLSSSEVEQLKKIGFIKEDNVLEQEKKQKLKSLKNQLSSTDYQIIKCYEYSLAGLELPYDIQTLHTERETIREQIRELEVFNI